MNETMWSRELETGDREVDREHRTFIERMDRFDDAVERGEGAKELPALLLFLDDHVRTHFSDEEKLHRAYRYPHRELHCDEHQSFVKELERLKRRVQERGAGDREAQLAARSMSRWFISHITRLDTEFTRYMKENRAVYV